MLKKLLLIVVFVFGFAAIHADEPTSGREGRAELRFLEGMTDHHQMALDMALDCLAMERSETLATLCQEIIDAQTPEIVQMQQWLLDWYNVEYAPMSMINMQSNMGAMPGMDHSMPGMPDTDPAMMMGMFAGFNRLEGAEYEIAWLESMIDHHDDAIHMSERLLTRLGTVGHADLKTLAQAIIDAQTAEIAAFEALLAGM